MVNWLEKIVGPIGKALGMEGQPREGPWLLPISGGWLPAGVGSSWNWWQLGYTIEAGSTSALVEACVSAYSQTVAMCPGDHWLTDNHGGRERITTSALCRVLRKPNEYQSISDFLLNAVRALYINGNAYALAQRNSRFEVSALHLMDPRVSLPMVSETGEVIYQLGGNQVVDRLVGDELFVPARDVLHIKLQVNPQRNMLLGESPLVAVARDLALTDAMVAQQLAFYSNQARPGVTLSTDMVLTKEQVELVRQRWDEQSKGLGAGGTPILTQGLKPIAVPQQTAEDMQLANILKQVDERIALAFRIPLAILGLGGSGAATEDLMRAWIASGLGFCLNHIEETIGLFFGLKGQPDEYIEFDTRALLRSAFTTRVEGYARGVQGGIFSPNEARAEFEMPAVDAGDEPRVQQQVVPLSAANAIPAMPPAPGPPSAGGQPAPVIEPIKPEPDQKGITDADDLEREVELIHRAFRGSQADQLGF
jgi:HK97 family phage portal protein